jgi:hypothetical protein
VSDDDDLGRKTYEFLRLRKGAYQGLGQEARKDLARFCRADQSCAVPGNHDLTMMLLGRQEVWLRMREHWEKSPEELAVLYDAVALRKKETEPDD